MAYDCPPPDSKSPPPIFHKYYAFLRSLSACLKQFPKKDRYTIGDKLYNLSLDLLIMLMRANREREYKRLTLLNEASFSLDVLKTFTRLAKDTHAVDGGVYIQLQGQLQDVGKQLGGWIRSLTETKKSA